MSDTHLYRLRVGDLLREPGSRRTIERRIPAPYSTDDDPLVTSASAVIGGTDIVVSGEAMAMAGGVELIGHVAYDWYGECRRCLEDVTGHAEIEFREIAQRDPVDDEMFPIEGDAAGGYVDLGPLIREVVLSTLPVAPLCREGCIGPDPERFPTTTEAEVEAERESSSARDPRWAALDELDFGDSNS